MKKLILSALAITLVAAHLAAQDTPAPLQAPQDVTPAVAPSTAAVILGYLSYNTVFQQLPEYAQAQEQFQQLKAKYDAESQRSEDEFQRKFSEFLQGQKDFPRSIMQKRQTELQQLMEQSIDFRQKAQQLLADAEAELKLPVRQRLDAAIAAVATRLGLIAVINTDSNAAPFLAPDATIDVTPYVLQELAITPNP